MRRYFYQQGWTGGVVDVRGFDDFVGCVVVSGCASPMMTGSVFCKGAVSAMRPRAGSKRSGIIKLTVFEFPF